MRIAVDHRRVEANLNHDILDHLPIIGAVLDLVHAQALGNDLFDRHARG